MVNFKVLEDYQNVPQWLKDVLMDPETDKLDPFAYGRKLIKEKQLYVEFENQTKPSRHHRVIPDMLDFDETAIAIIHRYPIYNIQMSMDGDETLLGAYHPSGAKKGTYDTNTRYLRELVDTISPKYTSHYFQETLEKMEIIVPTVMQTTKAHLVPVGNGIFNKQTKELESFSSRYIYLSKIQTEYVENAKNPTYTHSDGVEWDVESWLHDIGSNDPEITLLLWQVIADFVQSNYTRNKSIFLYSEKGNNGKGTFGEMLESLVGRNNVAHLSVQDFNHEFLKETLIGKVGNIAHENDVDDYIDSVRDFKATITGDNIVINRKYEKPIAYQFKGTNIQMFNGLPRTRDKSESFYRRILLVPFLQSFTNNGERVDIKDEFIHKQAVHEYVLNKALHLDFTEFTVPKISNELLGRYKEDNNPVIDFWNEFEDEFQWTLLPTGFIYDLFTSYYERVNPTGRVMSRQTFLAQLRIYLDAIESDWIDKTDRNSKVRVSDRMDADEELITEYNLENWMNKSYKGTNLQKLRAFRKNKTYRGFVLEKKN